MALPKVRVKTKEVELSDGQSVTVRGMTRGQFRDASVIEDTDKQEIMTLAFALGVTETEAQDFADDLPVMDMLTINNAIIELSGLGDIPKE